MATPLQQDLFSRFSAPPCAEKSSRPPLALVTSPPTSPQTSAVATTSSPAGAAPEAAARACPGHYYWTGVKTPCRRPASYVCSECGQTFCGGHVYHEWRVRCFACARGPDYVRHPALGPE